MSSSGLGGGGDAGSGAAGGGMVTGADAAGGGIGGCALALVGAGCGSGR